MMTKKRTRPQPAPKVQSPSNIEASFTIEVFHVVTDNSEHYFAHTKTQLLNYLAKKNFKFVSVVIEEVPTSIAYR
jgi:hypothetical protein